MRAPMILTVVTVLTALTVACVALVTAPAAAAEPPWQPATDLYSHMAGQDGGTGFEQAVRDMVTDHIKDSAPDFVDPWVDPAAQQFAPAPDAPAEPPVPDDTDDAEDFGSQQPDEAAAPEDAGHSDDSDGAEGGEATGSADRTPWEELEEPRFTGHPVPAEDTNPRRAPCVDAGGALVEVREHAGGQVHPLGVACVAPEHARPDRRTVITEAARRRVRGMDLPGGRITAAPDEGLAWLETGFRLRGASRGPTTLTVHGTRVGVRFIPVVRAWGFGDGTGADSGRTVEHVYRRGGEYRVTVQTVWTARMTLDGSPLTTVTGLVSRTTISYPVSELRAVLTE